MKVVLTTRFMKLQRNMRVHSKRIVIVYNVQWQVLFTLIFWVWLRVRVLFDLQTPTVKQNSLTAADVG